MHQLRFILSSNNIHISTETESGNRFFSNLCMTNAFLSFFVCLPLLNKEEKQSNKPFSKFLKGEENTHTPTQNQLVGKNSWFKYISCKIPYLNMFSCYHIDLHKQLQDWEGGTFKHCELKILFSSLGSWSSKWHSSVLI